MNKAPTPPPQDQEELVHADDAIIGRATRRSLMAMVILIIVGGGILLFLKRKPAPPPAQVTKVAAPVVPERPQAEIPIVKFSDITRESGITFVHNNGAYGEKLLPETMGSGVAFFDFDNDGAQDLLFVNSTDWPWQPPDQKKSTTAALYHNDGKGHFTDVTAGSGLDINIYGMGVAIGDYDNDGLDDVLITGVGGCHLFQNLGGGKFKEVTEEAGVGGSTNDWSTCAAWIDCDNDGKLDLYVGNYVTWSREIDARVGLTVSR
jgi:hypothetical protein